MYQGGWGKKGKIKSLKKEKRNMGQSQWPNG